MILQVQPVIGWRPLEGYRRRYVVKVDGQRVGHVDQQECGRWQPRTAAGQVGGTYGSRRSAAAVLARRARTDSPDKPSPRG